MRAVLCGYYGMGNGGDEALLATLLQMLPEHVTPIVLSGDPAATRSQYGVQAVPRRSARMIQATLKQADAFIWGGGSLMQDSTSALSPVYYAGLMGLAQARGIRTIAWAQGVGPLRRRTSRWLAQQCFQGCTAVSVRDGRSAQWLRDWGCPGALLAPDPVWALEDQPVPGLWDLPAPRVAVCLREHATLTDDRRDRLIRALATFQTATERDGQLACMVLLPFQPERDRPIAQAVAAQLPGPHKILELKDPRQLKGVFAGVEMAIAMRLHALIMAAAAQCRCFALSYDPKVTALMDELDLPGWDLTLPDADSTTALTHSGDGADNRALPTSSEAWVKAWLEVYANGDPLGGDRVTFLRDRANIHREVLAQTLAPAFKVGRKTEV